MSNNFSTPALVFNCDYNGLALIQSLGRRGVPVLALDSVRSIGTYSRYARFRHVPNPLTNEQGFIAALLRMGRELDGKPLLLPTNDHWSEAVARHKEQLVEHYVLSGSSMEVVSLLLDKERFGRWALAKGLPVPRVWSAREVLEQTNSLQYPVAVKANARRRPGQDPKGLHAARAADRWRFIVCDSAKELAATLNSAAAHKVAVFCQQVVQGRSEHMRTIGVYAHDGTVHGIVYGRKIRGYPPGSGDCIVGQAEPVPDWARTLARVLCQELSYTGIAEIEIMEDAHSGERFLIEVNPRSWSWVGVAQEAGVDLAWLAYADLVLDQQPNACLTSCQDGEPVIYSKILADFQNTALWYRYSNAPDWVFTPRQWWHTYGGRKCVFAEFAADDPWVSVYSILQSGKQFAGRLRQALLDRLNG